ncbi:uncharacterized protein BO80DRAFT_426480 [Aspergillus ibericus CBS 121593]|uniref:Uncharacterized protein n=1 Tax=Aspergillus ibericus CBS 121593 TaxID=1448316 RepID=A0A395GVS2_9EURO|nr:hypothetical protein BO80DRAFT_426480 [Aspergillus ibericus CBS 121593]RAK99489.1 hypothetical protein BO80DRAFT_426480 [Aspergillus ibericus CBS 121593]
MADCWQPQPAFANPTWVQGNQSCWRSTTFRDLIQAFPRPKHTGRVTKPRSAGNSPSSAGRRRTATIPYSSPMYQGYQAPVNATLVASALSRTGRTRPTSWHPAVEPVGYSTAQYLPATTALDNFAAIGVCPQPLPTAPATYEDSSMLPSYAPSDMGLHALPGAQQSMPLQQSFLQMNDSQAELVSWDPMTTMAEPISDCWSFDMSSMHNNIPSTYVTASGYESAPSSGCLTGPPTPDFLPIQRPDDDFHAQVEPLPEKSKAEDELVGMGLYSNPEASLESSLLGLSGKGLKLEETFTPSSDNEAEDQDDNDEEDGDEPEQDEGLDRNSDSNQKQQQPVKAPGSMMQRSFFFEDDELEQHAVVEPQPFVNMASQPCMNYGYGWI